MAAWATKGQSRAASWCRACFAHKPGITRRGSTVCRVAYAGASCRLLEGLELPRELTARSAARQRGACRARNSIRLGVNTSSASRFGRWPAPSTTRSSGRRR